MVENFHAEMCKDFWHFEAGKAEDSYTFHHKFSNIQVLQNVYGLCTTCKEPCFLILEKR